MTKAPLLQLSGISLTFGGDPVFDDLSLVVQSRSKIALVGRNGSGKSTLMKVMAGLVDVDRGERTIAPGISVGYMEQDPDLGHFETLGDFAANDLEPSEMYKIDMAAEGLGFDPERPVATASGGERRRAALAKLMAQSPDLLLLDEPTNHLDIDAVGWLETTLEQSGKGFVAISHDRTFLNRLTRETLWIDRGQVRSLPEGFAAFEAWRDKTFEDEDQARHKLDRKIRAEGRWAVEGISARRKRNQGRVRALQALREERSNQIRRQGTAAMKLDVGDKSGRQVVSLESISKSFGDRHIIKDFSFRLNRGQRVAFVGPNGAGKTTLIKLCLGTITPDSGRVTLGTNLRTAWFEQGRDSLHPDRSLWENLAGDKDMQVSGRADQILVRGQPRHVVGYLKEFLFDEAQARAPVRSLSGGEKARLLLARLMARESNLLVLDEPTNDLDIETLDLLQEILDGYEGSVLLVSHDRDFIDRVATSTVVLDGLGHAQEYAGGWTDYQNQKVDAIPTISSKPQNRTRTASSKTDITKKVKSGLTFTEKHRLEELPKEIERLTKEIEKLTSLMSDPELYVKDPDKVSKATKAVAARQQRLNAVEEEWLILAEKDEAP